MFGKIQRDPRARCRRRRIAIRETRSVCQWRSDFAGVLRWERRHVFRYRFRLRANPTWPQISSYFLAADNTRKCQILTPTSSSAHGCKPSHGRVDNRAYPSVIYVHYKNGRCHWRPHEFTPAVVEANIFRTSIFGTSTWRSLSSMVLIKQENKHRCLKTISFSLPLVTTSMFVAIVAVEIRTISKL